MNTLESVLHEALVRSEHLHQGLTAPPVRSTIARKRVARRAALSSAATVGAVGIGAGAYAISTGLAPTIVPAWSNPSPSANGAADPAVLEASRTDFCQHLPLVAAWTDAADSPNIVLTFGYNLPDEPASFGCHVSGNVSSDLLSTQMIDFTFESPPSARQECIDDMGTMTFETRTPTEQFNGRVRTGTACLDGVLVTVLEQLGPEGEFALTDAQVKAPAEASVALAEQARSLAP